MLIVGGAIALAGGAIALYVLPRRSVGLLPTLAWAGMFAAFVVFVAVGCQLSLSERRPGRCLSPGG